MQPSLMRPTTVRDRTDEFRTLVARLEKQQAASASGRPENGCAPDAAARPARARCPRRDARSPPAAAAAAAGPAGAAGPGPGSAAAGAGGPAAGSDFARRAGQIGLGIHSTSQKLGRLAQLAKQTSMFDDPAEAINELAGVVKQDIRALNAAISDLQSARGGGAGGGGAAGGQSAAHAATVVDSLRGRLKDATREFKDVLTLRTDNLRAHEERKSLFAAPPAAGAPGGRDALFGPPGASFLPENARNPLLRARGGPPGGLPTDGEGAPLLGGEASSSGQQQHAQQQLMFAAPQDSYLSSRQEALQQVESTIVELGGIFQQLAHMVHEQGEMAVRVDENVEDALANVNAGQAQLLRYLATISSNRWLMLKAFAVIVFTMLFFLLFVA
jgi:syntaxin 5